MLYFWYVDYLRLLFCLGFELRISGNAINCCLLSLMLPMSCGMLGCVYVLVGAIYVSSIRVVFQLLWLIYMIFCIYILYFFSQQFGSF